ncbi:MAG: hypothetical protein AAB250_11420 [Bdellovibrionota bacterium]
MKLIFMVLATITAFSQVSNAACPIAGQSELALVFEIQQRNSLSCTDKNFEVFGLANAAVKSGSSVRVFHCSVNSNSPWNIEISGSKLSKLIVRTYELKDSSDKECARLDGGAILDIQFQQ